MKMNRRSAVSFSRKASGFTLVEFGIVTVLLAVAAMFIYKRYQDNKMSSIAAAEAADFTLMAANLQQLYTGQVSFSGVNTAVLVQNGAVPNHKINGTNIITNWNTDITVAAQNLVGTADVLRWTYSVPKKACSDFVTQAASSALRVIVNGTATVLDRATSTSAALDVAMLGSSCNAPATPTVAIALDVGR